MSILDGKYSVTARRGGKSLWRHHMKIMRDEHLKNIEAIEAIKVTSGRCEIVGIWVDEFLPPPPPWSYRKWCLNAIASYRASHNPSGIERNRP